MLASLHVADVGLRKSFRMGHPDPADVPGLLDARSGIMARFNRSIVPDPAWGLCMWLGFWDEERSLDRFLNNGSPIVKAFDDGWNVRMEPLRGHGAWPGFPPDPEQATDDHSGPVVVLTLGLLRLRRSLAWTRASNDVQRQLLEAPGVIWAMGASRPPLFAATMSIWESAEAASTFARDEGRAHATAVAANTANPFMRQEIFARFKPLSSTGSIDTRPPLTQDWLQSRTP